MSEPGEQEFRIAFDGVYLKRGGRRIFDGLSCGFPRGRISVVLGGSGAGKSTLIRMIGGLQRPDSGSIRVADQDITAFSERQLFKVRDRIGMLFQGGALLDSMTVFENVALPLREHTRLPTWTSWPKSTAGSSRWVLRIRGTSTPANSPGAWAAGPLWRARS